MPKRQEMRTLAALLTSVFFVVAVGAASAENYSAFGFTSNDVDAYKELASTIPSCSKALANDDHDLKNMNIYRSALLAPLYGQCRHELKVRHVRIQIMRVNDLWLGMNCLAIETAQSDDPACHLPSSLPNPRK